MGNHNRKGYHKASAESRTEYRYLERSDGFRVNTGWPLCIVVEMGDHLDKLISSPHLCDTNQCETQPGTGIVGVGILATEVTTSNADKSN
jgi:hypothetical protein